MEQLSYKDKLALIRFRMSMLMEVKEAALIANDAVFRLLLDTLCALDERAELRRGFEYFRETPDDEAFSGFVMAEMEHLIKEFRYICRMFDDDDSLLEECGDALAAVMASVYVIIKNDDAFLDEMAYHFCRWKKMYDYEFMLKFLAALPVAVWSELFAKWQQALDDYQHGVPEKERLWDRKLALLIRQVHSSLVNLINS